MKVNAVINTTVEAMAEKIDRLKGELFCKDYEIEKLKDENESLKKAVENLKKALVGEDE
jgi:peptidoglycan hydrolase CwlO-like protein